tara:strand:- start:178 stop:393 length:216 start_codon:yes stop_codon:yes gene_type:complete
MKHIILLFLISVISIFISCGDAQSYKKDNVQEIINVCVDSCEMACCLGCKATKGDVKCIVLEDGSMPCCIN